MGNTNIDNICHVGWEAFRAFHYQLNGYDKLLSWHLNTSEVRTAIMVVVTRLHAHPDPTPELAHEYWMEDKLGNGWVYGPVKDSAKKTHPCIVPYYQLSWEEKVKDALWVNIIKAMTIS